MPFMLFSLALMAVGASLITTLEPDTLEGKWIWYQILFGLGLGTTLQTSVRKREKPNLLPADLWIVVG